MLTVGRAASTAVASTSGAATSGVFSTTASLSVGGFSSSTTGVSSAAISVTCADLKAASVTRLTSNKRAAETCITPPFCFDVITSTPTLKPDCKPSSARIKASVPRWERLIENDA